MKKIALITYKNNSDAYEALSKLKTLSNGTTVEIKQAAIIEKSSDENGFSIKDSLDFESGNRIATGGLIGAIVGILGGPLGVLCGWVVGDIAGIGTNYVKTKRNNTIFDKVSQRLNPGDQGLLVYMDETNEELVDIMLVDNLGGEIRRYSYQNVKEDIRHATSCLKEEVNN
ncbi:MULTISPECIES: hypothetical protein [Enterococcus]|uniref:DUF1269 domain-containing protein n=1 Tax=Enterococcus gilvus ATCC BAA-350 TaxID=1158614 RepID=R2Y868_9ENTE|nr:MULTISPECIES: hypothetical protein [Enterococcus]EOI58567.1 hypothetical protein UKC_00640 [Enterococcus gilvus ATCC BAA-350]EOW79581.1 hypothetical protein I592_03721 [Enterococcus gilvus ATCC BAA-350]OJG43605.1 hypothetical protein RV02_GL002808 [Enterococcus gilvus]OTO72959.1 hypothetical protein A5865_001914 [Enterococcus sp. 12E11_DIV0728]OUZ14424.1 hypothetical protein A5868_003447 [Enterococcus sp. 12F9_DIV0723]